MKLITLNTWGGRIKEPLAKFIQDKSKEIDIFCFQEVYSDAKGKISEIDFPGRVLDLFQNIKSIVTTHTGFFKPNTFDHYGVAVFVQKDIKILEEGDIFIYKKSAEDYVDEDGSNHPRNLQYILLEKESKKFVVANVHGLWTGTGKKDTVERIEQSNKIKEFLSRFDCPIILAGDFNLEPDTESIALLENDMKNLVKEYNIKNTRTSHYKKEGKFADYIFTKNVSVNDFNVLPDEVSDHAPLYLDFEI